MDQNEPSCYPSTSKASDADAPGLGIPWSSHGWAGWIKFITRWLLVSILSRLVISSVFSETTTLSSSDRLILYLRRWLCPPAKVFSPLAISSSLLDGSCIIFSGRNTQCFLGVYRAVGVFIIYSILTSGESSKVTWWQASTSTEDRELLLRAPEKTSRWNFLNVR